MEQQLTIAALNAACREFQDSLSKSPLKSGGYESIAEEFLGAIFPVQRSAMVPRCDGFTLNRQPVPTTLDALKSCLDDARYHSIVLIGDMEAAYLDPKDEAEAISSVNRAYDTAFEAASLVSRTRRNATASNRGL